MTKENAIDILLAKCKLMGFEVQVFPRSLHIYAGKGRQFVANKAGVLVLSWNFKGEDALDALAWFDIGTEPLTPERPINPRTGIEI